MNMDMMGGGQMNPMMMGGGQMNPMMMGGSQMNPMMMGGIQMNPMMMGGGQMNPMMMGGIQMNPMMMGGIQMNPMMMGDQMNPMMGMNSPQTVNIGDAAGWNLIFEEKKDKKRTVITISPDKTVNEAISLYKIKTGAKGNEDFKFIFNGKQLFYELKISQSGLTDNSVISVISTKNVIGA